MRASKLKELKVRAVYGTLGRRYELLSEDDLGRGVALCGRRHEGPVKPYLADDERCAVCPDCFAIAKRRQESADAASS